MTVLQRSGLAGGTASSPSGQRPWHAVSVDEAVRAQDSAASGLTEAQARERLTRFGPNRLPPPKRRGPLVRFLAQFHDVLIYVLLGAMVLTALLGHWVDSQVILAVVLVNAIIGFLQEGKAENALEAIRGMLAPKASVIRDGHRMAVPGGELVPGDIVLLEAGARVPADVRLIDSKSMRIDEAVLTGESVAVEKDTSPVDEALSIGDRTSMAFSGTLVTYGQGKGVVIATGAHTAIGQISGMLSEVTTLQTPLTRQMGVFAKWLTGFILGLAVSCLCVRPSGWRLRVHRDLHGRGRADGCRHSGRAAGHPDHHLGDRRPGHGAAKRHRPTPAGDRDAWVGLGHLFRQDGDLDTERNGRRVRGDRQAPLCG